MDLCGVQASGAVVPLGDDDWELVDEARRMPAVPQPRPRAISDVISMGMLAEIEQDILESRSAGARPFGFAELDLPLFGGEQLHGLARRDGASEAETVELSIAEPREQPELRRSPLRVALLAALVAVAGAAFVI